VLCESSRRNSSQASVCGSTPVAQRIQLEVTAFQFLAGAIAWGYNKARGQFVVDRFRSERVVCLDRSLTQGNPNGQREMKKMFGSRDAFDQVV